MIITIFVVFFCLVTLVHIFIYFLEKELLEDIKRIFPKGISQNTSSFFVPTKIQFTLLIWRGNFVDFDDRDVVERCKQLRRYYFLEMLLSGILVSIFIQLLIYK